MWTSVGKMWKLRKLTTSILMVHQIFGHDVEVPQPALIQRWMMDA